MKLSSSPRRFRPSASVGISRPASPALQTCLGRPGLRASLVTVVRPQRPPSAESRSRFQLGSAPRQSARQQPSSRSISATVAEAGQFPTQVAKSVIPKLDLSGLSAPIQCAKDSFPELVGSNKKSLPVGLQPAHLFPLMHSATKTESLSVSECGPEKRGFFAKKKLDSLEFKNPLELARKSALSQMPTQGSLFELPHSSFNVIGNLLTPNTLNDAPKATKFFVVRKKSMQLNPDQESIPSRKSSTKLTECRQASNIQNTTPILQGRSDPGAERLPIKIRERTTTTTRSISIKRINRASGASFARQDSSNLDEHQFEVAAEFM